MDFVIKNPAPQETGDARWGDQYFGEALERALTEAGCAVRQDFWPEWDRGDAGQVTLVLRGLRAWEPPRGGFRILWIISHPAEITADELNDYDLVLVASRIHAQLLSSATRTPIRVALQCTDEASFHPPEQSIWEQARGRQDLVYVANTRGVRREMGQWLLDSGRTARIFGRAWEYCGLGHMVEAQHLANPDVAELYRHARIALNDHWLDMRGLGYINNRLFDCLACGIPVISDDSPELRELFGDALYYARSAEEFDNAVRDCEADYAGALERVTRTWAELRDRFTFRTRATELMAWVEDPPHAGRLRAAEVGRSLERRLEALLRTNAQYEGAQRVQFGEQIRAHDRAADQQKAAHARTAGELEKARHQLERAAEERDRALRQSERHAVSEEAVRAERDRAEQAKTAAETERDRAEQAKTAAETERDRAEQAKTAAETEVQKEREALEHQRRLAAVTLRYTERLERSLRAVLASASWRMTAPLRLLTGLLRLLWRGRRGAPIEAPQRPPEMARLQERVGEPNQPLASHTRANISTSLALDRRAPARVYRRVRGLARAGIGRVLRPARGTPSSESASGSSTGAGPTSASVGAAAEQPGGITDPNPDTVYWRQQALQLLDELEYVQLRLGELERHGVGTAASVASGEYVERGSAGDRPTVDAGKSR